jgi:hypothetical protein
VSNSKRAANICFISYLTTQYRCQLPNSSMLTGYVSLQHRIHCINAIFSSSSARLSEAYAVMSTSLAPSSESAFASQMGHARPTNDCPWPVRRCCSVDTPFVMTAGRKHAEVRKQLCCCSRSSIILGRGQSLLLADMRNL